MTVHLFMYLSACPGTISSISLQLSCVYVHVQALSRASVHNSQWSKNTTSFGTVTISWESVLGFYLNPTIREATHAARLDLPLGQWQFWDLVSDCSRNSKSIEMDATCLVPGLLESWLIGSAVHSGSWRTDLMSVVAHVDNTMFWGIIAWTAAHAKVPASLWCCSWWT